MGNAKSTSVIVDIIIKEFVILRNLGLDWFINLYQPEIYLYCKVKSNLKALKGKDWVKTVYGTQKIVHDYDRFCGLLNSGLAIE